MEVSVRFLVMLLFLTMTIMLFPMEFQQNSNRIPWIPSGIIPRGSRIPTISIGIPWKKVGISMEMEPQMAEAPAKCFP